MTSGDIQLCIEQSLLSDCGIYAVSFVSQLTSRLTVDINCSLPVFTQCLSDQPATIGQPIKFTVMIHGVPAPQTKWYLGDTLLTHTVGQYIITDIDGGAELTVVKVSSSDVGLQCRCVATNVVGQAVSVACILPGWSVDSDASVVPADCRRLTVMG